MSKKNGTVGDAGKVGLSIFGVSFRIVIWILVVILLYTGIKEGYQFGYAVFDSKPVAQGEGVEKTVTIPEKPSPVSVAKVLEEKGLVKDKYVFVVQYLLFECEPQPGTYTLSTSMSPRDIIQQLNKAGEEDDSE